MAAFDSQAWRRLYYLAKPFFFSEIRWRARGLLFVLLLFLSAIKGFDVVMSYIGRDFMTALSLRERDAFMRNLYLYLLAFAVATPLSVFYRYTEERLALLWRGWFSQSILKKYFSHRAYYRLAWYAGIDNPDQRIEEDVRTFTSMSLSLFLIFLQSLIALVAFIGVLSSISWTLTMVAVGYATIGSIATYFLGRPLIGLNFEQLRREADYRYKLVKVRDNSEAIAFYRGERTELTRTRQRLKEALRNLLRIINRNRLLNFFTTGYNYAIIVLPTIVVAPLYLDGQIEFGVVTQSAVAFGHVLNALSVIVTNFGSLSAYAAVVRRLGAFTEALDQASNEESGQAGGLQVVDGNKIECQHVTIETPNHQRVLAKDLNFSLEPTRLLICGPSGSGKSSLLRSVAGLWTYGQGRIIRPPPDASIFIPQRPYLPVGSLRSQLLYGQNRRGYTDDELLMVLQLVGLEDMYRRIGSFEARLDFATTLSNGEQQRIGMARAVLARPPNVFLDEATTAVEQEGEQHLYEIINSFAKLVVSVGYRANLAHQHDWILDLKGDGKWTLERSSAAKGGKS